MIQLGDLIVILDLHRQGLSTSAIARRTGRDPKTIRKYIARGLEPPAYGPRQAGRPSKLAPYFDYLRQRIAAFPDLSAVRLTRELRERGYTGAYTAVKRFAATIRPDNAPFEVRFETPAGQQAQVDFAHSRCAGVVATACTQGKRTQHGRPHDVVRDGQPDAREGQTGRRGVAERFVVCAGQRMNQEG